MVNRLWVKAPSEVGPCGNLTNRSCQEIPHGPTNLVSQIVEALSPTIVSRIASSLGLDQSSTQKAINAAVPGLLAALISMVSKPQGASKLADVVAKQPPGVLSSLADVIGGSRQKPSSIKALAPSRRCLAVPLCPLLRAAWGDMRALEKGVQKACSAFSDQQPWASLDTSSVSVGSMPPSLQDYFPPRRTKSSLRCLRVSPSTSAMPGSSMM